VRRLLLVALLSLAVPSAAEAKPFAVGTGQNGGIAIDDAGSVYVGWQVNVNKPGDGVQFCLLPPRATQCAAAPLIAFPGNGYNRSRVSVLLPAPNVVDVVVPRTNLGGAFTFLARSTDGGRTFGSAVRIAGTGFGQGTEGPGGAVAMADGPTTLRAGVFNADGSSAGTSGSELGQAFSPAFTDVAFNGTDVLAAESDTATTHTFRLPPGVDDNNPASWQQIDPGSGRREPEVAGLPGGFAALMEPTDSLHHGLFVQRLEGAGWSPPVQVFPPVPNNDFALDSNARGRLSAHIIHSTYDLTYSTSTDGGVLWSSVVRIGHVPEFVSALESATNSTGAGAAVMNESFAASTVTVTRFTPRIAPVKRRRIRGRRVQVRSICDSGKLSLVVEAARGNRRVSPASVLRRARFGRTRAARPGFRTRFRARYTLRRSSARIPVRLVPRRGKARTLRLRVRRC
jgi:hypothetical protein